MHTPCNLHVYPWGNAHPTLRIADLVVSTEYVECKQCWEITRKKTVSTARIQFILAQPDSSS